MSGEMNLERLLASMRPKLHDEVFVFATTTEPVDERALSPRLKFEEEEGTTLIVTRDAAEALGLAYEFPCRMITLNVHSSLEAVGFIAAVATRLTKVSIGANPVSGFFHDHLFVPQDRAADALTALEALAAEHGAR